MRHGIPQMRFGMVLAHTPNEAWSVWAWFLLPAKGMPKNGHENGYEKQKACQKTGTKMAMTSKKHANRQKKQLIL